MKKTLESFIEPQNIPKKYGGELDFEFGYAGPTLDPILEKYLEWKTEKKEFPMGPLYWRNAEKDGHGILELVASGSENNGVQRHSVIAVLHTPNTEKDLLNMEPRTTESTLNGSATESSHVIQVSEKAPIIDVSEPSESTEPYSSVVLPDEVEQGMLVPADRPRLDTFVTASEGLPLSPTYSGPVVDVPDTNSEVQEATEQELANRADTPEEPLSPKTTPAQLAAAVNGEEVKEKTELTSRRDSISKLNEKLKTSLENASGSIKRDADSLAGGSEKGSLKSQKSLKARIKDRLVK